MSMPMTTGYSWRSLYRHQVMLATAFAAIGLPYVLLTNTTASVAMIWLHTMALWLFIPPVSAVVFVWLKPWLRTSLAWDVGAQVLGLFCATTLMLVAIRLGTGVDWTDLLVRPLVAALVPLYSWYILFRLYRGWQRQRTLAIRAQGEAAAAKYEALNARIQPHFLYNTLANLEELIAVDPERAQSYVRKLARLFRGFLAALEEPVGTVADEVALAEDYLAIQQLRFGDRLSYSVTVEDTFRHRKVPKNLLINLVENAVKHGAEPNHIEILFRSEGSPLQMIVRNPVGKSTVESSRLGLRDLRERLLLTARVGAAFHIEIGDDRAEAIITLPGDGR